MKFTFKGYVKIKVELVQIQDQDAVKVSISDTGAGISKNEQANLFQLFGVLEETRKVN